MQTYKKDELGALLQTLESIAGAFKIPKFQNFAIWTSFANFVFRERMENYAPWNFSRKFWNFAKPSFAGKFPRREILSQSLRLWKYAAAPIPKAKLKRKRL